MPMDMQTVKAHQTHSHQTHGDQLDGDAAERLRALLQIGLTLQMGEVGQHYCSANAAA